MVDFHWLWLGNLAKRASFVGGVAYLLAHAVCNKQLPIVVPTCPPSGDGQPCGHL